MKDKKENKGNIIFDGPTNFKEKTQIAGGDIVNVFEKDKVEEKKACYNAEPIWRSPFTLAILSWTSVVLGLMGLIPGARIVQIMLQLFNGGIRDSSNLALQSNICYFFVIILLLLSVLELGRIARKQIRLPIAFNYAISGIGKRINIEKMHIDKCPLCGGKMCYYNKPMEWRVYYVDGKEKKEVTKKKPVLECKRNSEHYFFVDPAEDKVS